MTKDEFMAIPEGEVFLYKAGDGRAERRTRLGAAAIDGEGRPRGYVNNDDTASVYHRLGGPAPGEIASPAAAAVRGFSTGATRSSDAGRYDPEGFLSPIALERFCEYMNKHRVQADGTLRDSDNWQKGMPLNTYMKGMWRHFLHLWQRHRGWTVTDPKAAADVEEDLCAMWFNVQGMLHELLKARRQLQGLDRPGDQK